MSDCTRGRRGRCHPAGAALRLAKTRAPLAALLIGMTLLCPPSRRGPEHRRGLPAGQPLGRRDPGQG